MNNTPSRRTVMRLTALTAAGFAAPTLTMAAEPDSTAKERQKQEAEDRLHTDWAYLGCYHADNARRLADQIKTDVVFLGDSITAGWVSKQPEFFIPGRVGRGIGGQTTPQMLVRFRQDVIDLRPRVVHIMAGTNDIAQNTGPMTQEQTQANIQTMTELAQAHGIKVILASVPASGNLFWNPATAPVVPKIRAANAWLQAYATSKGALYADYWSVLADESGAMKPGYAYDGVHPTETGYGVMRPVAEAVLAQALGG